MAKNTEEIERQISQIEQKIKKLSAKKNLLRRQIDDIQNMEILELAKQIKNAGKIEEARLLVATKTNSSASPRLAG